MKVTTRCCFAGILLAMACGGSTSTAPAATAQALHGDVSDPIGDVLPYPNLPNPPDLMHGTADVVGTNITLAVRLAPGTFDAGTSLLIINLDTDQDSSTGQSMAGDGVDYIVSMGDGQGNQALIGKYAGTFANFSTVGAVSVSFVADGMTVTVPLSVLGNDDGKLNFRVLSFTHLPGTPTSGALDVMPDVSVPSARVQ